MKAWAAKISYVKQVLALYVQTSNVQRSTQKNYVGTKGIQLITYAEIWYCSSVFIGGSRS